MQSEKQFVLRNEYLTVTVSEIGAELTSVRDSSGRERIWPGDSASWSDHAPILFPFCGRTYGGKATADGIPCRIPIHGFFRLRPMCRLPSEPHTLRLVQESDAETLAQYPYPYRVELCYSLSGNTLTVTATVSNTGGKTMHYGFGAHPGFVLASGIDDYRVRFANRTEIREVAFNADACYPVGGSFPFPLKNGTLSLSDRFFRLGSHFFCDAGETVTLIGKQGDEITVGFPGFPYLGLWKIAGAPFLCIEPWCSLPAYEGETVEFSARPDFLHLPAGASFSHTCTVTFHDKEV